MIASETLTRLEFDKLLAEIALHANCNASAELIRFVRPQRDIGSIRTTSARIEEIRQLDRQGIVLALGGFDNIRPALDMVRPAGSLLSPHELLPFIPLLRLYAALARQLSPRNDIPHLKNMEPQLRGFPDILEPLEASIDRDGSIMDSASPLLKDIRRAKRGLAGRIRKKIEEIIRSSGIEIFLQDDFITQRSGRWVIPVRMDSKGMVKGVVHDVSSSGETAFMEPLEIIPFVNELENLTAEEKGEEIRILRQLSGWIREDSAEIAACFETLLQLDVLNSMARFALQYDLQTADINEQGTLRLVDARHPLLLMLQRQGALQHVEPLMLELGLEERERASVMVITGPNAGGKTIALKTAGILALMALCGLPVPAGPRSTVPLLNALLVDIGDEQSIAQSHSTFSAHAARIASILEESSGRSLVLLDELGAGTEPLQGGAIACGVLSELQQRGSLVIATTHLSEIIGFVHRSPGMLNAGMEFDDRTFTPLYRLIPGEPGQSHAIEIARRFGMPERVIEFARRMLGSAGSEFASLLRELRQRRSDYEELRRTLESRERDLELRARHLDEQKKELAGARREAAEKGWADAKDLIAITRKRMNGLLDELKQGNRTEIVEKLRQAEKQLTTALKPQIVTEYDIPLTDVSTGDTVRIGSLGCNAVVLSRDERQGKVRVRAGRMELDVQVTDLFMQRRSTGREREKKPAVPSWLANVAEHDQRELKLIGMRVEQALTELDTFINRASSASLHEVRIIHGVGSGRLRDVVREELQRHPLVNNLRPGEPHEGRDGATVVTLLV
ncbi:MAG TPA: endonuclease MutS2 [Desulfuromonadales bacterium]|nr:endonuclease MutS2 [Desulfuromonadales bacterium]